MSKEKELLLSFLIAQGDDAVVLGHRLSEWCSNAPYLEEDIALANTALDYIGRARMFYQYAAKLEGKGRSEDDIAYLRDERQYTNLLMHELPINDFAFTMLRQYYLDEFYCLYLPLLCQSSDETVAAIATKALKESHYHLKRSKPWITQLAQGTEESRRRLLDAKEELQNFIGELFESDRSENALIESGVAVDRASLKQQWADKVTDFLAESEIELGDIALQINGGRDGIHTEHLGHMLSDMQYVQRANPGLSW